MTVLFLTLRNFCFFIESCNSVRSLLSEDCFRASKYINDPDLDLDLDLRSKDQRRLDLDLDPDLDLRSKDQIGVDQLDQGRARR